MKSWGSSVLSWSAHVFIIRPHHHDGAACAAADVPGVRLSAQIHILAGAESSDHCRQHRWSLQQRNVQGEVLAPLINLHKELPQCQNYSWQEDKSCSTRTDEASSSSTLQIELSSSGILWQPQKLCCEREGYVCYRNLRRYWNVPSDEKPDIESKIIGVNLSLWTWLTVAPLPAIEVLIFWRVQRNLCKIFISF